MFPSRGKECGEAWIEEFLQRNGIIRKKKQGKAALEGNQCNKLLSLVDILERDIVIEGGEAMISGLPYVKAFRDFRSVVQSCFSTDLKESYRSDIDTFGSSYKALGISTTPKVEQFWLQAQKIITKTTLFIGPHRVEPHSGLSHHKQGGTRTRPLE